MTRNRWSVAVAVFVAALAWSARTSTQTTPGYVGAKGCTTCHQKQAETWTHGRHSKMIQPASSSSIIGDFSQQQLTLRGKPFRLRTANGQFFVTESYLTGEAREHRVEYTLGSRRIQHYLTTIENGRIIVLPPSWDVQRRQWFDNMEIVRPDERDEKSGTPVQQWNKNCVGCHVSQQNNNYRPSTRTYATTWTDFGTSCERCHGPGSAHVDAHRGPEASRSVSLIRPTRLEARASSAICAQCHSMHDLVAPGYQAGSDYYDYFQPVLEYGPRKADDPAYWADGRPRRFSNDAMGLWQSECFIRGGATCTSCHYDPHLPDVESNPQLAPSNSALCTGCHKEKGLQSDAHTHHRPDTAGSSCVECHMPKTVISIKATMRDHTIGLPAPENTVAHGIPNACTECHSDRPAAWAVDAVRRWWPQGRRQKYVDRAAAFTAARDAKPEALEKLIAMVGNADESPLVRANAAGYLASYRNASAARALTKAITADHPAIRSAAVWSLGRSAADRNLASTAQPTLVAALDDRTRAVRLAALIAIVNAGVPPLGEHEQLRFRQVSEEFAQRARMREDDPGVQRDLGLTKLLTGEFDAAAEALQISRELDPEGPSTRFFLAMARLGQRRSDDARALLKEVPKTDPFYAAARNRLAQLENR